MPAEHYAGLKQRLSQEIALLSDRAHVRTLDMKQAATGLPICQFAKDAATLRGIAQYLTLELTALAQFYSVGKNMSENQVLDTVDAILDGYGELSLTDFALFFKSAKVGFVIGSQRYEYGKLYDRLDGAIVLEWLRIFMEARQDARERRLADGKRQRQADLDSLSPEELARHNAYAAQKFAQIRADLEARAREASRISKEPEPELTPEEQRERFMANTLAYLRSLPQGDLAAEHRIAHETRDALLLELTERVLAELAERRQAARDEVSQGEAPNA